MRKNMNRERLLFKLNLRTKVLLPRKGLAFWINSTILKSKLKSSREEKLRNKIRV